MYPKKQITNQQLLIIPVMLVLFALALLFIFNLQSIRPLISTSKQTAVSPKAESEDPQESEIPIETANIS